MSRDHSFAAFGSLCAILAGLGGLAYAYAFLILARSDGATAVPLYSALLLANGLLAGAAYVALYERSRGAATGFALWGLLLTVVGQMGASVHGAFDLSTVVGPGAGAAASDVANMADPRGFLTFLVTGLGILALARAAAAANALPGSLSLLGSLLGLVLIWIYLARLLVLDPTSPLLAIPVLAGGFLLGPAWYIWLGLELRKPGGAM
jgi:hypothetical protein